MKRCDSCRKHFDDTWQVCLYCSRPLIDDQGFSGELSPKPEAPGNGKRILAVILTITGVLFLIWWGTCGPMCGMPPFPGTHK